jgi:hypothetical protein
MQSLAEVCILFVPVAAATGCDGVQGEAYQPTLHTQYGQQEAATE